MGVWVEEESEREEGEREDRDSGERKAREREVPVGAFRAFEKAPVHQNIPGVRVYRRAYEDGKPALGFQFYLRDFYRIYRA